ncbi:hypothetical protein HI914_04400 [Erysiphe necator]|nr:hypothetical protein HI914_04400 [Erysiphe necator]
MSLATATPTDLLAWANLDSVRVMRFPESRFASTDWLQFRFCKSMDEILRLAFVGILKWTRRDNRSIYHGNCS